jgi:hypothetical protein
MKVGDLVVQLGWEADGVGIVTRVWNSDQPEVQPGRAQATVQWPNGVADMYRSQLKVVSESR